MRRNRIYWHDFETGRRGFTDGDLPDGPLVEETTAKDFYANAEWDGVCVCGKAEMDGVKCRYGATHKTLAMTRDDEALS